MRPAIVIASIFVVVVGSIAALWSYQRTTARSTDVPDKLTDISLRLNGPFGSIYAGEMVAAQSGLFEREGLHLKLKPGGVEVDPIALVASGIDTFGVARGDAFLVARAKGAPIVAFAAGYLESPVVFYGLEQSKIHVPQDFIGKRVVRQAG